MNTIEECYIISLKDLRRAGYLAPNRHNSGIVEISRRGKRIASFGIIVSTVKYDEYLRLSYTVTRGYQKTEIDYKVPLVRKACNIGNGYRYYFLCPVSNRRCFKLYNPPHEDYFLHRSAFSNLLYERQMESKRQRLWHNTTAGKLIKFRKAMDILFEGSKYRKFFYAGIPTKQMQRFLLLQNDLEKQSKQDTIETYKKIIGL